MKFRTELNIKEAETKINYKDNLFFIGSCFSDNVSDVLRKRKFSVVSNPFGIIYNPISIFKNIELTLSNTKAKEIEVFYDNELWKSFFFHSDLSLKNKKEFLENIDIITETSHAYLKRTKFLFITFGTAWVYEKDNLIVANCHKVSKDLFQKRLLTITEIIEKAQLLFNKLLKQNSDLNIILTVSPVRHLKDGFIENNQSKSVLHLAVKGLCDKFEKVNYFPSYEFVIDDLRDYRFYKEDFVHPNSVAIKYIIQKFDDHFFDTETKTTIKKVEKLNKSLNHKVLKPNTKAHVEFKENIYKQIDDLENMGFSFLMEKENLKKQS